MSDKYWRKDFPSGEYLDPRYVWMKPDKSALFYLLNRSNSSALVFDIVRVDWSRATNELGEREISATESLLFSTSIPKTGTDDISAGTISFTMTDAFDAAVFFINGRDGSVSNLLKGWVIDAEEGGTLFSLDLSGTDFTASMRMFCRKVGSVFHWAGSLIPNSNGTMRFGYNGSTVHTVDGTADRAAIPGFETTPYSISDDGEKWGVTYQTTTYRPVLVVFNRGNLAFERDLGEVIATNWSPCWSEDSVFVDLGGSPFVLDLSEGLQEYPVEDTSDEIAADLRNPQFGAKYGFKTRFMTEWASLQLGAESGELIPGYRLSAYALTDGEYVFVPGDPVTPQFNVLGNTNNVVQDVIDCIRPGFHEFPVIPF